MYNANNIEHNDNRRRSQILSTENWWFFFLWWSIQLKHTESSQAFWWEAGFLYHHQSPLTSGMSGVDRFSAAESWEGVVDNFTAAKKELVLLKREVHPRPLKHGQVSWQTSKGSCIQPWMCCPCNGKLHSLPLNVCNQLLPPLYRGTVIYRKTCLFAMSVRCLRDGLFALNIERLPFIKMNKYFLTYRGGNSQEIPLSNLSVRSETHSR